MSECFKPCGNTDRLELLQVYCRDPVATEQVSSVTALLIKVSDVITNEFDKQIHYLSYLSIWHYLSLSCDSNLNWIHVIHLSKNLCGELDKVRTVK